MDCSLPGSSVHGILQTRILERVAISLMDGSCHFQDPGIFLTQKSNPGFLHCKQIFLPTGATREALLSRQALSFKRTNSVLGSCIMAGKSHNRKPRKQQAGWFASKPLGILQSISMELIITPESFCPFLVFRRQSRH